MQFNKFNSSTTVELHSLALAMKQARRKVFSLAAGEPKMPAVLLRAFTADLGYPPVSGMAPLKRAASVWLNKTYEAAYTPEEVSVVPGAKLGIFLLLRALLKPGEQAAITAPYWVSYPELVRLAYAKPLIIKTSERTNWKLDPDAINQIHEKKCKVLVLNNASNPCGVLYSKKELYDILSAAQKKSMFVISDEVYSGLVYNGNRFFSCGQLKQFKNNLAVVQSCSKNFAMPGIRTGFVFASKPVISVVNILNSQTTSGVSKLSQRAALQALTNPTALTWKIKGEMVKRRDLIHGLLEHYWRINIEKPKCALYFFLPVQKLFPKYSSDKKFSAELLKKQGVVIVPGSAFGQKGYVRLSFGSEPETIRLGIKALAKFCGKRV